MWMVGESQDQAVIRPPAAERMACCDKKQKRGKREPKVSSA